MWLWLKFDNEVIMKKSLKINGNFCNPLRGIYNKPTANAILNGEIVKALALRSREDKNAHVTVI